MSDQAPAVFHRDRSTWLHYTAFAVFGYFIYVFGASVSLLRDDHGTSATIAGMHGVCYAIGAVTVGVFGDRVVRLLGRKRVLWSSLFGLGVVSAVLLGVASGPLLSLLSAMLAGLTANFLINVVLSSLSDRHGRFGASAITEATALGAAIGVTSPLVLGGIIVAGWNWRIALLVLVVMVVLAGCIYGGESVPNADHPERAAASRSLPPAFWPAWLSLLLCGSLEFCFIIWSSDVLQQHAHASMSLATLGLSAVVVGLVIGRLVVARLATRFQLDHILHGSLVVVLLGFCAFWLSTIPVLAMIGLFIAGIGVGPMFPLSIARLIGASEGLPDLANARASLAIGIAFGGGPLAIGVLADQVGVYRSMLVIPVLLAAAAAAVWWSARAAHRGSFKVQAIAVRSNV